MTMTHDLRVGIPSIRSPASSEIITASVLLCETAVCFLQDHDTGRHMWLPNMHYTPLYVDFESDRSPAKSAP